MTDQKITGKPLSDADTEWIGLMRRAERGELYPPHFARLNEIRADVSPELRALHSPPQTCTPTPTNRRHSMITKQSLDPRDLITPDEFAGVTAIVEGNNPGIEHDTAEAIVAEALKYLAACGLPHTESLRPSRTVDEGWHALILTTRLYAPLCERLAGTFIHHVPERGNPAKHDAEALTRTTAAIRTAGYEPDFRLWRRPDDDSIAVAADCEHTQCGDATCTPPCDPSKN